MLDEQELQWAQARSAYELAPLRNEAGRVAPHYRSFLDERRQDFDQMMESDPVFAGIIESDLRAERVAHAPLHQLARFAANNRVRERYLRWLGLMNVDLEPWGTGGAIHFRPHWARVLLLALNLGSMRGLNETDLDAVAAAAVFHDSRRKDPYLDTGHGARGASYYLHFCQESAQGTPRTSALARSIAFDPRSYLAVCWHDRDDEDGLAAIAKAEGENALPAAGIRDLQAALPPGAQASPALLYRLFKDADGLDRVRLGANEPNVRFLRLEESLQLLPFARELLEESMRLDL